MVFHSPDLTEIPRTYRTYSYMHSFHFHFFEFANDENQIFPFPFWRVLGCKSVKKEKISN